MKNNKCGEKTFYAYIKALTPSSNRSCCSSPSSSSHFFLVFNSHLLSKSKTSVADGSSRMMLTGYCKFGLVGWMVCFTEAGWSRWIEFVK